MTTPPTLSIIQAITQFVNTSQADWNSVNIPIPAGLVVFTPADDAVKVGDGVTLYADLPVAFYFSQLTDLLASIAAETQRAEGVEGNLANLTTSVADNLVDAVNAVQAEVNTLNTEVGGILNNVIIQGLPSSTWA